MEALVRYITYAFHSFSRRPDFIRLSQQESLQGLRFLKQSPAIMQMNRASLAVLQGILRRITRSRCGQGQKTIGVTVVRQQITRISHTFFDDRTDEP